MSSEKVAALEAQLAVATLEDELAEARKGGDDATVRDVKHRLREARFVYRSQYRHLVVGGAPGDAAALPDPIEGKIEVKS